LQLGGLVRTARIVGVGTSGSNAGVDRAIDSRLTWFDRSNRLFLRDAQVVPAVERVLDKLETSGITHPRIFSGQMGIVMYTLASARLGRIDVTDRHGLADNRFVTCSVASSRQRLTNGLAVDYSWYLSHRSDIQQTCNIAPPDVIYDIEDVNNLG